MAHKSARSATASPANAERRVLTPPCDHHAKGGDTTVFGTSRQGTGDGPRFCSDVTKDAVACVAEISAISTYERAMSCENSLSPPLAREYLLVEAICCISNPTAGAPMGAALPPPFRPANPKHSAHRRQAPKVSIRLSAPM